MLYTFLFIILRTGSKGNILKKPNDKGVSMLIIILLILLMDSIILAIIKKDVNSLLILGLCGSLIIMLSGIIIYTAKIGGLSDAQYIFLFLSIRIQTKIQYMIITLDKLGYLIAIGRYLFPLFLLLVSIKYSTIPFLHRHARWMWILVVPPAVSLVLYYPQIFYIVVCNRFALQRFLMTAMLVWIILYLTISIGLLIKEYMNIPIVFFRRHFQCIMFWYISLAFLYGIHCLQDPIQVYQLYGSKYLWVSGISYANPSLPFYGWILITAVTLLLSVLGLWNLISYTHINYKTSQEEVVLQRKFNQSSAGASVFVHSIKNQLLSSGVVHKKINKLLDQDSLDTETLKEYLSMLNQLNENMLSHMNRLYSSIKTSSIKLKPIPVDEIVKTALTHFAEKYPDYEIDLKLDDRSTILGDKDNLSEALYNLLINAQEAVLDEDMKKEGKVELSTYKWRIYTILEVSDNGNGIPKSEQKKILDPFFTTKNTNYNWGMGLHYAQRIAKSHFGVLRFESVPGEGTKFFIMLPRYKS